MSYFGIPIRNGIGIGLRSYVGLESKAPAWTPSVINTSLWLDANDPNTITLNGSTVSQWNDKSGNGRNAVQATAANQPGWGVAQNLLLYSEQFGQTPTWTLIDISISADAITAPDGTLTADKIQEIATTNFHMDRQIVTYASSTQYTVSCYFKKAERDVVVINPFVGGVGGVGVYFNLTSGTVSSQSANSWVINSTSITSAGDDWYRASITFTTTTGGVGYCDFALSNLGTNNYLGTVGYGAYMWGCQLQPGTLQPYQKTTSAAQTLSTGLNGKATLVWPTSSNSRFIATTANVPTRDFFAVTRFGDGTQSLWIYGYQGLFGDASGSYIGLIGNGTLDNYWYQFSAFKNVRRNGGSAQDISTGLVSALPLPTSTINATNPTTTGIAPLSIGMDRNLSALNRGWSGIIAEVIVLDSIASTSTRQNIEGYLAWKWGGF